MLQRSDLRKGEALRQGSDTCEGLGSSLTDESNSCRCRVPKVFRTIVAFVQSSAQSTLDTARVQVGPKRYDCVTDFGSLCTHHGDTQRFKTIRTIAEINHFVMAFDLATHPNA